MKYTYEELLQRSNAIGHFIEEEIRSLDHSVLSAKPAPKKWSVIEVVDHLNRVYDIYLDNFRKAIESAPKVENATAPQQSTLMGRLSIYTMKPKKKKIRFKMKTFDFFQPETDAKGVRKTLDEFKANKEAFNDLIRSARSRDLKGIKMPTALGEKVKFYVPECFAFVLAHEERHMEQISQVLAGQSIERSVSS